MGSPYPLHYTLRWPFYYMWPSIKNHSKIPLRPLQHHFIEADREDYIRLHFCGDIMLTQKDRVPNLHHNVCELINSSDLLIGNCEAPVGDHPLNENAKYNLIYHMPEQFLTKIMRQLTLAPQKILLSVANNHAGDKDKAAFFRTLDIFSELGISALGYHKHTDLPLTIIELNGVKIGFAAWTHWMNREIFVRNEGVFRTETILSMDWGRLKEEHHLDTLIGLPHWEYEFQHFPKHTTRKTASHLMMQGFNLLIGAHPHTLQPIEWFSNGMCAYSLGNFCGLGLAWPVRLIPILEVRLGIKDNNKGKVLGYKLHYFAQVNSKHSMDIVPLEEISPKLQQKLLKRLSLIFQTE